jgi:uncharacterized protein (DUF4415 family)
MPKTTTKPTGTDWQRVKREAAADAPIDDHTGPYDPNDQAATAAYWQQATITRGRGRPAVAVKRPTLNMRVDADVLDAFKATGPGWQTRINAVLRDAVAHGVGKA